jgi:transglutaminase-like putative cysteine protease
VICRVRSISATLLALTAICGSGASAAPEDALHLGAPPPWVKIHASAEGVTNPAGEGGEAFLLVDQQVHLGTQERYGHFVRQVLSEAGLRDNGTLEFEFDPAYQRLTVHQVDIVRGGERSSRLDRSKAKIIQQEKELDAHIYNGRYSVVIILDDLRVGDQIEYAYTVEGRNPIFDGRYAGEFTVQWSRPVASQRLRIVVPGNRKLFVRSFSTQALPRITEAEASSVYEWEFTATDAVIPDDDLPPWYEPFAFIQLSEYRTWGEVAEWGAKVFETRPNLGEGLQEQIQQWKKMPVVEERVVSALKFVQNEVRYMGMTIGEYSHKPAEPATVLARRFGDCKDKAVLFCAILRQLGIEAHPGLVNTSRRHTIAEWHPSPSAFDHVIVLVTLAGQSYWVDPTRSSQGGRRLKDLFLPNYGSALVLRTNTDHLSSIPFSAAVPSRLDVREQYSIKNYNEPVRFRVDSSYEGLEADRMRGELANKRREELEKQYLNFYAKLFPKIVTTEPLIINDDPITDVVKTVEEYHIEEFWSVSDNSRKMMCEVVPHNVSELLSKPSTRLRTMPIGLPYPRERKHVVEITFPKAFNIAAEQETINSEALKFRFEAAPASNTVRLTWNLITCTDRVDVLSLKDYLSTLDRIEPLLSYTFERPRPAATNWAAQLNWPIIFGSAVYVLLLGIAGVAVCRYAAVGSPALEPLVEGPSNLNGIRGWLVLMAIGVVLTPLRLGRSFFETLPSYGLDNWQTLTLPGGAAFHPLWAPYLLWALIGNLTLLVAAIFLPVLFFQRRRLFPKLYLGFLVFGVLVIGVDFLIARNIPDVKDDPSVSSPRELIRACSGLLIWGSYLLVSRRVKATFIH